MSEEPLARLIAFLRAELDRPLPDELRREYAARLARASSEAPGVDDAPVESLGLDRRWTTALRRAGVETVGQVARMDDAERQALPNVGPYALDLLKQALDARAATDD